MEEKMILALINSLADRIASLEEEVILLRNITQGNLGAVYQKQDSAETNLETIEDAIIEIENMIEEGGDE